MSNYVAARVVAVPVCRPARPTRAHPSLAVPFTDGNMAFAHGSASFADGNATFADGSTAFLVWKRRCADVRAGTQAPPLPFQHLSPFCKGENKNFNARSDAANDEMRKYCFRAATIKRQRYCSRAAR